MLLFIIIYMQIPFMGTVSFTDSPGVRDPNVKTTIKLWSKKRSIKIRLLSRFINQKTIDNQLLSTLIYITFAHVLFPVLMLFTLWPFRFASARGSSCYIKDYIYLAMQQ